LQYQDYYSTLGVDKGATATEIQRSYRKLARTYHPDINKDPEAESRFKEIGEAYEVLKDPEKRTKYDRYGSAWNSAQSTGATPPGWDDFRFDFGPRGGVGFDFDRGASGFSSFFDMLFGGRADNRGWGPSPSSGPRRGTDHESRLKVRLEETAHGGQRRISLTDPQTGGKRTLEVKIPKGVREGRKIRLRGKGGQGINGGEAGDLLLHIEIEPHPHFRVDGADLHSYLEVSPSVAALGGRVEVLVLDGSTTVKLPPGSSSGRKIRLRGKGLPLRPSEESSECGDLYAEVRIMVPQELTKEEKKLFEQLAESSGNASGR
jgi:curved DNA-binding protein